MEKVDGERMGKRKRRRRERREDGKDDGEEKEGGGEERKRERMRRGGKGEGGKGGRSRGQGGGGRGKGRREGEDRKEGESCVGRWQPSLQPGSFHPTVELVREAQRGLPASSAALCNFLPLPPAGWNKRIEYAPGAGSLALFPSIHLETCDEPLWNIQATIELQTSHVAKGCDRDNYSERALRKLCGGWSLRPQTRSSASRCLASLPCYGVGMWPRE